jgi:hypothetical protein
MEFFLRAGFRKFAEAFALKPFCFQADLHINIAEMILDRHLHRSEKILFTAAMIS